MRKNRILRTNVYALENIPGLHSMGEGTSAL